MFIVAMLMTEWIFLCYIIYLISFELESDIKLGLIFNNNFEFWGLKLNFKNNLKFLEIVLNLENNFGFIK